MLLWQADDLATVTARATQLARANDGDLDRLLDWCRAFAGMIALELAAMPEPPEERLQAYVELALQARV